MRAVFADGRMGFPLCEVPIHRDAARVSPPLSTAVANIYYCFSISY
jgi:hypothetical protein